MNFISKLMCQAAPSKKKKKNNPKDNSNKLLNIKVETNIKKQAKQNTTFLKHQIRGQRVATQRHRLRDKVHLENGTIPVQNYLGDECEKLKSLMADGGKDFLRTFAPRCKVMSLLLKVLCHYCVVQWILFIVHNG